MGQIKVRLHRNGYSSDDVFASFMSDHPFDIGDVIQLDDGAKVRVIGYKEQLPHGDYEWTQDLGIERLEG